MSLQRWGSTLKGKRARLVAEYVQTMMNASLVLEDSRSNISSLSSSSYSGSDGSSTSDEDSNVSITIIILSNIPGAIIIGTEH